MDGQNRTESLLIELVELHRTQAASLAREVELANQIARGSAWSLRFIAVLLAAFVTWFAMLTV